MKKSCLETIRDYIDFWSTETPDNMAVNAPSRKPLVYKQLKNHVEYVACFLNKMGIGQKDRVAIVLPNGPEMATAFISVAAYCSSAPLNQNYRTKEYHFYLTDLNAKAVILPEGIQLPAREVAQELKVPVVELKIDNNNEAGIFTLETNRPTAITTLEYTKESEDEALVLHTSGTTALPKIVPLKHKNVIQSAKNIINTLKLTSEDRCLNIMPLFHIHGLIGALLSSITVGGSIVCSQGFDDNIIDNLRVED